MNMVALYNRVSCSGVHARTALLHRNPNFKPRHCPGSPRHAGVRRLATKNGPAIEAVTVDGTRTNAMDIDRQRIAAMRALKTRDAGIRLSGRRMAAPGGVTLAADRGGGCHAPCPDAGGWTPSPTNQEGSGEETELRWSSA